MKKIDDYVSTILTSDLSDDEKVTYLRNLNMIHNLKPEQIAELEEKIAPRSDQMIKKWVIK